MAQWRDGACGWGGTYCQIWNDAAFELQFADAAPKGGYPHLKRYSRLCGRLPKMEHYADGPDACDERCGPLRDHRTTRPPERTPLSPASIIKLHSIISAALSLAARHERIERNAAERARCRGCANASRTRRSLGRRLSC